jgi:hypothetical protein
MTGTAPTAAGSAGGGGASAGNAGIAAGNGGVGGIAGAGGAGSVATAGTNSAAGSGGGDPVATGADDTGSLPAIMDPTEPGSFTPQTTQSVGPGQSYTTIAPQELGRAEVKHPIVVWGPGAGANPALYRMLLEHIASHGFVVVSYNSTPEGQELNSGIDWILEESMRSGSPYAGKLDTQKIAMGGQSAGSLATFQAAKDEQRITTTLHINGGSFNNGMDTMNLSKPALFLCGDDPEALMGDGLSVGDLAHPMCNMDFAAAKVPVWYGVVKGSSHTTVVDTMSAGMSGDPQFKKPYLGAHVAWLRWQLAGDQQMKKLFVGPDCGYCKETMTWVVQQKDLN